MEEDYLIVDPDVNPYPDVDNKDKDPDLKYFANTCKV